MRSINNYQQKSHPFTKEGNKNCIPEKALSKAKCCNEHKTGYSPKELNISSLQKNVGITLALDTVKLQLIFLRILVPSSHKSQKNTAR